MPLSAVALKNAKPRERPYKLADEKGLYLLVRPNGAKWWRFDYRFAGKRKTISLGVYSDVGLAEAREQRDAARAHLRAGTDPSEARREAAASGTDHRFESVGRAWHEARKGNWSKHYTETIINRLERNVFPDIGKHDIRTIRKGDILAALKKVEDRGAIEAARRIRNYCSEVFEFAIAGGLATDNPALGLTKALKSKPPKVRRAALKRGDLPRFLVRLRNADAEEEMTLVAMRLTLLTVVRTVETRFAAWSEFEDLGGPSPLWRIGAERMKMRNEHLIPLSRQAVEVLLPWRERTGGAGLLFAKHTRSRVISENAMLYALYRWGYHSRATIHGFRGSFSTLANEQGWNRDWVERQLAHVEKDEVRGAYNAAEYLSGRRELLQWWADELDAMEAIGRLVG